MRHLILGCLTVLALSLVHGDSSAQAPKESFRIVVNESLEVDSVSKSLISKILLKQVRRWENGTQASPIDLHRNSPVREAFSTTIHGRKGRAIESYWQRQIFSGGQSPPPMAASDQEVIAHVQTHPGGIGYVSSNARLEGVREVRWLD